MKERVTSQRKRSYKKPSLYTINEVPKQPRQIIRVVYNQPPPPTLSEYVDDGFRLVDDSELCNCPCKVMFGAKRRSKRRSRRMKKRC